MIACIRHPGSSAKETQDISHFVRIFHSYISNEGNNLDELGCHLVILLADIMHSIESQKSHADRRGSLDAKGTAAKPFQYLPISQRAPLFSMAIAQGYPSQNCSAHSAWRGGYVVVPARISRLSTPRRRKSSLGTHSNTVYLTGSTPDEGT